MTDIIYLLPFTANFLYWRTQFCIMFIYLEVIIPISLKHCSFCPHFMKIYYLVLLTIIWCIFFTLCHHFYAPSFCYTLQNLTPSKLFVAKPPVLETPASGSSRKRKQLVIDEYGSSVSSLIPYYIWHSY